VHRIKLRKGDLCNKAVFLGKLGILAGVVVVSATTMFVRHVQAGGYDCVICKQALLRESSVMGVFISMSGKPEGPVRKRLIPNFASMPGAKTGSKSCKDDTTSPIPFCYKHAKCIVTNEKCRMLPGGNRGAGQIWRPTCAAMKRTGPDYNQRLNDGGSVTSPPPPPPEWRWKLECWNQQQRTRWR